MCIKVKEFDGNVQIEIEDKTFEKQSRGRCGKKREREEEVKGEEI